MLLFPPEIKYSYIFGLKKMPSFMRKALSLLAAISESLRGGEVILYVTPSPH
jgi:hypothetical protein